MYLGLQVVLGVPVELEVDFRGCGGGPSSGNSGGAEFWTLKATLAEGGSLNFIHFCKQHKF